MFKGLKQIDVLAPEALRDFDPNWEERVASIRAAARRVDEWIATVEGAYVIKTSRMTQMDVGNAEGRGLSCNELVNGTDRLQGLISWREFVDSTHRETYQMYSATEMLAQLRDMSVEEMSENVSMHPRNDESPNLST